MKTKLLLLIAVCSMMVGCVCADPFVSVTAPAVTAQFGGGFQPIPVRNTCTPVYTPYVVDRPILPANFPCPERVPSYSVARPVYGGPSMMIIDCFR